jgi:hypothetical protein
MPANHSSTDYTYTFDTKLEITVDGSDTKEAYDIAEITVVLPHNSLPMITLEVTPTPINEFSPERIQSVTLKSIMTAHARLQTYLRNPKVRVSFSVQATSVADTQRIAVEKWIILRSGITNVSADGTLGLLLELVHPAWLSSTTPGGVFNTVGSIDNPTLEDIEGQTSDLQPESIPDLFIRCVEHYIEKVETEGGVDVDASQEVADIFEFLLCRMIDGAALLNGTLQWYSDTADGFPDLATEGGESVTAEYVPLTLWPYVGIMDSPLFNVLTQYITSDYDVAVSGAATDERLLMTPYTPWGKPAVAIYDDEISNISLPVNESLPAPAVISGDTAQAVTYFSLAAYGPHDESQAHAGESIGAFGAYLVPIQRAEEEQPRLISVNPPPWITIHPIYKKSFALSSNGDEFAGLDTPPESTPTDGPTRDELVDLMSAFCEGAFYRIYKADASTAINTRLMMQVEDAQRSALPSGMLRPGISVQVRARPESVSLEESANEPETDTNALYAFFVTTVVHKISPKSGQAGTSIQGNYTRSFLGYPQVGIETSDIVDGIEHPLYAGFDGTLPADKVGLAEVELPSVSNCATPNTSDTGS